MFNNIKYLFIASGALLFAACGGGGDAGTTLPTVPVDYALRTAYINYVTSKGSNIFTVSGTYASGGTTYPLSGNGTVTKGALSATTFEKQVAQVKAGTVTGTLTLNGINTPMNVTEYEYYDVNYNLLGGTGTEYIVVSSVSQIPLTARVNDTGSFYSANRFTTSAKTTQLGTKLVSYVIEQNSEVNAYLTIIATDKNMSGATTATASAKFSVTPAGALTRINETGIQFTTNPASVMTLVINY